MNQLFKGYAWVAVGVLLPLLTISGCSSGRVASTSGSGTGGNGGGGSGSSTPTITLTGPHYLTRGVAGAKSYTINATTSNGVAPTYSSDQTNYVKIDSSSGQMTPESTGSNTDTATITATDGSATKTYSVSVDDGIVVLENSGAVVSMNLDGSAVNTLMSSVTTTHCISPVPSYDHLELLCGNANNQTELDVYQLYTSNGAKQMYALDLSTYGFMHVLDAHFLPTNDSTIVFLGENANSEDGIYTIAANGQSKPIEVYNIGKESTFSDFTVTLNGKNVVFYNGTTDTVWEVGIDGSNPHQLVSKPSTMAVYSPDGSTLYWVDPTGVVYTVQNGVTTQFSPGSGYYLVDVSPTGDNVLLEHNSSLYVENKDGSAPFSLIQSTQGAWSE